jgi:glycosyltransferase involved in cell wall biosynthesis
VEPERPVVALEAQPGVTVVVCTRDRPLQLQACLDALVKQRYPKFHILVVDNACAEPVDEICRIKGVACIHEPVPGLTRARNVGARAARAELIAYIDDDAIPEPQWLEALAREFVDPAVAAVAGKTRYMKALGDTLFMSDEPAPDEIGARPHRSFDKGTQDWFALACFGGIGDGNTMAFRRDVIASSDIFDERLGRGRLLEGGDEHVAFMSLIADGYRVNYAPDAIVRHPTPATPALQRARRFRDLSASIAHVIFLWFEFPAHRGDIIRFLRRAVMKRIAGAKGAQPVSARLSRSAALLAMLGGIGVYWRARREWAAHPAPVARRADSATAPFVGSPSRAR